MLGYRARVKHGKTEPQAALADLEKQAMPKAKKHHARPKTILDGVDISSGTGDFFRHLDIKPEAMKSNEGMKYGIISVYFEGNPKACDYHTSADAFGKCYKVFRKSVRANTNAVLHVIRPDISELDTKLDGTKGAWYSNNELKARKWTEAAQKIKRPTVFMDIDTCVLGDLSGGFQGEMTITRREEILSWFNSGVVFVQPTQAVKDFFLVWYDRVKWFYNHIDILGQMKRDVHCGIHQLSFISLLREGKVPLDVKVIDANIWNASRKCWKNFGPETKVIHATAELRREAFEIPKPIQHIEVANEYKRWLK